MRVFNRGRHQLHALVLWCVVALLLTVPAQLGLLGLHAQSLRWQSALATLGIIGILLASSWCVAGARKAWVTVMIVVLLALLFVRMLFFGLVRFSGRGFNADFFLALQPTSVSVAWAQYRYLFVLFALCVIVLVAVLVMASRRMWAPTRWPALGVAAVLVIFLAIGFRGLPEWQLWSAGVDWYAPQQIQPVAESRMEVWRQSALLTTDLITKQQLTATAATPPKNLILLYIESGGVVMAPAAQYPGLTPNLTRLVARHSLVPHIHASSYITIEGIVNTQCGTLYPFDGGSEAMASFDNLIDRMPCLGDVLAAAGYRQSYLGGSEKSFAGKGRFLKVHGFDKVMGLHDWGELDLHQRPGTWGLSDVDLFAQSLLELKRLKASGEPYNLTMLTIGTHLPGFAYAECEPYADGSQQFLNAVHCTDQLVGDWIKTLKQQGFLDADTVLVITGDHHIFPNGKMTTIFGDAAVADHRLPLIVLGENLPKAQEQDGAGYDIAPTILDLLGVKSNVRFAMGRSLLRDTRSLDYFPSRYIDILGERRHTAADDFACESTNSTRIPGEQPLAACERSELFDILATQARAFSAAPSQMVCNSAEPLQINVPRDIGEPLQFNVSGAEQAARFTWHVRQVDKYEPGLYLLTVDAQGKVRERLYAPPDAVAKAFSTRPELKHARLLVIAWRPGADAIKLPDWLPELGVDDSGGAWLFKLNWEPISTSLTMLHRAPLGATLAVSSKQCAALLEHGSPAAE